MTKKLKTPEMITYTGIIWNYERKLQLQRERKGQRHGDVNVRTEREVLQVRREEKTLQQMA